ncbi:MAG: shikimate dehydrogenase [Alkalispirochaeta sp.]
MALNFKQDLTAVFGHPVAENPTQVMAEAAYVHYDLNWRYLTVEVLPEDLPAAVAGARAMGFGGFNLTIPHKVAVIPHLDGLGESAKVIGAVNCVVRRGDQLIGENTDGRGFLESLREVIDPQGARVTMIGAGGAARAIAVELALAGATSVTIINRSEERAADLVEYLQERLKCDIERAPWGDSIAVPEGTDVLINATSIGLYPDVSGCPPIDFSSLSSSTVVADVIPNPPHTPFLRHAEERGCRTIDGLGMLINQGRIGIQYWTGIDPDPTVMRTALETVFAE